MKIVAIVDSVGRVILGRHDEKSSTKTTTAIKNPAVVNIQVDQQSGQISVQLIPFIFREFVKADLRDEGVTWTFNSTNIVTSNDLVLEDNIVDQYEKIFEAPPAAAAVADAPVVEAEAVQVFDEEQETEKA